MRKIKGIKLASSSEKFILELEKLVKKELKPSDNFRIELSEDGNITFLGLYSENLETLPDSIGDLEELEELCLGDNHIKKIPPSIEDLKNLHTIEFELNKLDNLPESFLHLKNLEQIWFSCNNLNNLPEWFSEFSNLKYLYLSNNNFTHFSVSLRNLKNLVALDISDNMLLELPEWMGDLKNLEDLELDNNKINRIPESLKNIKSLHNLRITRNPIKYLPAWIKKLDFTHSNLVKIPEWVKNLKNIEYLDFSFNNIKNIPEWIGNLHNLKCLELSYNKLKVLPDSLLNLKNLKILKISSNRDFKSIPNFLKTLLNSCYISFPRHLIKDRPELLGNMPTNKIIEHGYQINSCRDVDIKGNPTNEVKEKTKEYEEMINTINNQEISDKQEKPRSYLIINAENILSILSDEWVNIKDIILILKIKDMMDVRFLQVKLKELERKNEILMKIIEGKKHWKLKPK